MIKSYGICSYNLLNNQILVYVNKDNKLLFYKGKQEKNETPKQTAIREFFEESGFITKEIYLEKYFEQKTKNKLVGIFLVNFCNIENQNNILKITEDIEMGIWVELKYENYRLFTKNQQEIYKQIYYELNKTKYKILKGFLKTKND
jgi:8-oxo-dGTP pyrophosphatase MutT (NUDIX family)